MRKKFLRIMIPVSLLLICSFSDDNICLYLLQLTFAGSGVKLHREEFKSFNRTIFTEAGFYGYPFRFNFLLHFIDKNSFKYIIPFSDVGINGFCPGMLNILNLFSIAGNKISVLVDDINTPGIFGNNRNASRLQNGQYYCWFSAGVFRVKH